MAERKSPVMAIIGKNGPQEYETGDGLPLDLGGGGSGGVKLYKHELTMTRQNYKYIINILSTELEAFIDTPLSSFMSNVIFLNGQAYMDDDDDYIGSIIAFPFRAGEDLYYPVIYSSGGSITSGSPPLDEGSIQYDFITEWNG